MKKQIRNRKQIFSINPSDLIGHKLSYKGESHWLIEPEVRVLYKNVLYLKRLFGLKDSFNNVLSYVDKSVRELSLSEHKKLAEIYSSPVEVIGEKGVQGPIFWSAIRQRPTVVRDSEGRLVIEGAVLSDELHVLNAPETIHYEYDVFTLAVL